MELLTYLLKVSACTALFFSFYLLILRKLTFFKINRFYLLGSLVLSFSIPAIQINIEKQIKAVETLVPLSPVKIQDMGAAQTNQLEILPMPVSETPFDWFSIIPYFYFGVVTVLLFICLWQLFMLIRFAMNYSKTLDGLKLVVKTEGFTNCSFFKYVFIDKKNLTEAEMKVLLKHEKVHANQYHSIDKVLLMICKAFLWLNPIVYLFDKALEETHEYEADAITSADFGSQAYASLLLKLAITKSEMPLIHNFVKSPIKARIKMLFNSKSNNMKKLIYLLVLPIGFCLAWIFSVQIVYAETTSFANEKLKEGNTSKSFNNFIEVRKTKFADGTAAVKIFITLANVKKLIAFGKPGVDVKFLINKKIYTLEEAKNFDKNFINKLGEIKGSSQAGYEYDVDGVNDGDWIVWFGETPKLKAFAIKSIQASKDYTGKTISGTVSAYSYTADNRMNGFLIKTKSNVILKVYVDIKLADLVNKQLSIGDEVKVKAFNAFFPKVGKYITIGSSTVIKNGKIIFDRAQLVADNKENLGPIVPKIISSSGFKGDVKAKITHFNDAVVEISGSTLKAKYVEWNQNEKIMIAKHAVITNGGSMVVADKAIFDLTNGTYKTFELNSEDKGSRKSFRDFDLKENMIDKSIQYEGDSVKMSKDKNTITIVRNAKMLFRSMNIEADEIIYNSKTKIGSAKNMVLTQLGSGTKIKGTNAKFNLNGKVEIWQAEDGNIIVNP